MNRRKSFIRPTKSIENPYTTINLFVQNFDKTNKISTTSYTYLTLVPKTLLELAQHPIIYIYFFLISLELSGYIQELSLQLYTIVPFIILLCLKLLENWSLLRAHKQYDSSLNTKVIPVYKENIFQLLESQAIIEGDLVLLRSGQEVPADSLILASEAETNSIFFKQSSQSQPCLLKKKSIRESQNLISHRGINLDEMKHLIQYVKIKKSGNMESEDFCKIKFRDNPIIVYADKENFIECGSILVDCEWILVLSVFVGSGIKKHEHLEKVKHSKKIDFENFVNFLLVFSGILFIFYFLVSYLTGMNMKKIDYGEDSVSLAFYLLTLFGGIFPIGLYLVAYIQRFISTLVINHRYLSIQANNPRNIGSLGKVEFLMTEVFGALAEKDLKAEVVVVQNSVYVNKDTNFIESYNSNESQRNENDDRSSESQEMESLTENTPETIAKNFGNLRTEAASDGLSEELMLFITALIVCNEYVSEKSAITCKSSDLQLMKLASFLGMSVKEKTGKTFVIDFRSIETTLSVIPSFKPNPHDTEVKMIIKNHTNGKIYLIHKLNYCDLDSEELEPEDQLSFESEIKDFESLERIVFLYKPLNSADMDKIKNDYKSIFSSRVNVKYTSSAVFNSYLENMKILGQVGLKIVVSNKTKKLIKKLQKSGIKTWITTCESEQTSLNCLQTIKLLTENTKVLFLNTSKSRSQAQHKIESAIQSLFSPASLSLSSKQEEKSHKFSDNLFTNQSELAVRRKSELHPSYVEIVPIKQESKYGSMPIERSEEFAIVVDEEFFKLALSSRHLLKGLVFLMASAKAVVLHSLSQESKMMVIRVVKESLRFRPCVMAVGSELDLHGMLTEADLRVKVSEDIYSNWFLNDISISKFEDLNQVLFGIGERVFISFTYTCILFIVKEVSLITMIFIYQSQCLFSGCPFLGYDLFVMYEMGISFFYILAISLFLEEDLIKHTQLSCDHYLKKLINTFEFLKLIGKFALLGVIQGILMTFFIILSLDPLNNKQGKTEDLETTQVLSFIIVTLKLLTEGLIISKASKKSLILTGVYFILFIIILICVFNSKFEITYLYIEEFVNRPVVWLSLFLILSICSILFIVFLSLISSKDEKLSRFKNFKNVDDLFTNMIELIQSTDLADFVIDSKRMRFKDESTEDEYLEMKKPEIFFRFKILIVAVLALMVVDNVLVELGFLGFLNFGRFTVVITSLCFGMVLLVFIFFRSKSAYSLVLVFLVANLVLNLIECFLNDSYESSQRYPIILVFFLLILSTEWVISLWQAFVIYLISVLVTVYETNAQDNSSLSSHIPIWLILMLFITLLTLIANYSILKAQRSEHTFIKKSELQVEKTNTILAYLLPEFVRKRVKDGVRYIAEDKGTVSVIFCDIYDFESITENYDPSELTFFLNDLFGRIDHLCEHFGITKVETVGKTYLACAGLKDSEIGLPSKIIKNHHSRRAVEFALAILKIADSITLKDGKNLQFKIGVNSGPVTAGVVGYHKPQFSLVGDTVNTASRMASTLRIVNSVQLSLMTFDLLQDKSSLSFADQKVEVKGKGIMETKLVKYTEKGDSGENTADYFNRRSSIFSVLSSPSFESNTEKEAGAKPNTERSSLLLTLGANTVGDLFKKQTARRVNSVFDLICKETEAEKKFRLHYLEEIEKNQGIGMILSLICESLLTTVEIILYALDRKNSSLPRLLVSLLSAIFVGVSIYFRKSNFRNMKFSLTLSTFYTLEFIGIFISEYQRSSNDLISFMYFSYKFILINFYSGTLFLKNLLFNFITISLWISHTFIDTITFPTVLYNFSFISIVLLSVYLNENRMRVNTVLKNIAQKEVDKTEQLLTHMMPQKALSTLEQGKQVMDKLNQVTVMFADIVGFTAWSSIRKPKEVVNMLSELFTRFDKTCVECNVYKVHTIGDCYVAMGYLDDKNRNPAKEAINMLNFANKLIELINETNEKCGISLGMRIGMHTGEIIGGIIGTKIIRYDIYGIDVQLANKMESNGQAGKVAVSQVTKELIEDYAPEQFKFEFAKSINGPYPGKEVNIYFFENDN